MRIIKRKALLKSFSWIMCLILIPVILLNMYYALYWTNYIRQQEFEKDTKFLSITGQIIDTVLNDVIQVISLLEFDQLLNDAVGGLINEDGNISPSKFMYLDSVWGNISRSLMAKPYIRSTYLYLEDQKFVFTTEGIRNLPDMTDVSWLESYQKQSKDIYYWTEVRTVSTPEVDSSKFETMTLFRRVPFLQGIGQGKGVIVVDFEKKFFDSIVSNVPNITDKKIFILDDKYTAIYRNCPESINSFLSNDNIAHLKNSNIITEVDNEKYLVSVIFSKYYDWKYISIIRMDILLKNLNFMKSINILICVLSFLLSIIFTYFYSLRNYQPIKTMMSIISKYNEGKDISNITFPKKDEYGYIIYNILKNFVDKKDMQNKLTDGMLLQRETQLFALQSQINPHFLYNTLEVLNWESINQLGKNNTISKMLLLLSNSLRYTTNYNSDLVSIEAELNYLNNYISIQQILNMERIEFITDCDSSINNCKTLKLLIQPILENAITHGLANRNVGGKVKVSARCIHDKIRFKVIDNGCGIDEGRLKCINKEMEIINDHLSSDSLGLKNTNQRIKIRFGNEYGITIRSKLNRGTVVYITIPLIE